MKKEENYYWNWKKVGVEITSFQKTNVLGFRLLFSILNTIIDNDL